MVQRRRDGTYAVRLTELEREALRAVCHDLRALLEADPEAPVTYRLFPPAYTDDDEQEEFFRVMARGELLGSRRAALEVVENTAERDTLTREELESWMTAVNSVRLALGTALDVTEDVREIDPDDPNIGSWAVYDLLSVLLGSIVRAMAES